MFVPRLAKAWSVRFWNEPGISPIILHLLLHHEGICEFKNFGVQLVLLHIPEIAFFLYNMIEPFTHQPCT